MSKSTEKCYSSTTSKSTVRVGVTQPCSEPYLQGLICALGLAVYYFLPYYYKTFIVGSLQDFIITFWYTKLKHSQSSVCHP